ncbi:metallophosphoesterase [Fimbriiglobus ruber]|uniref:Metallophosphoesterase n=1 Tax=Fimbriiglobus ruber TaxID=1908690 RepID=A0A225DZW1_9BACT|nr:metallophosphoesterase [Fimbriiglobus ruber]
MLGRANAGFTDFSFLPDTLFLTWQRDPTTTMTVQWVGHAGEHPDIFFSAVQSPLARFGPGGGSAVWSAAHTTARPFPYTDLLVFRAELTGLTPGTEYQFRIGSHAENYRFRTMPTKATNGLSFVSGGDCGVNSHAAAVNVLAARQDPHFAVIGGDLAYDNGISPQAVLGFLRNYSRYMVDSAGRLIPMLACIGNHEVIGGYAKSREAAPLFLSLFDGLFRDHTFATLDFGDYLSLVLLDSGHVAPIGGEQADWLGKSLKDRAERPHVFAVNHVPAYPSYRPADSTGAGNRQFWVPQFEQHNVDIVLEHHDHTFKRTHPLRGGHVHPDGVLYLGDGSWGQIRAVNGPESRPYLAATGQAYHVSLHRLEGNHRYHMALDESGKIVDVCSSTKRPMHRRPGGYRHAIASRPRPN